MTNAKVLPALLVLASPALAEPMTGAEFQAYSEGYTLHFKRNGRAYGSETYYPGGNVTWYLEGNECQDGYWYEDSGEICFVYDHNPAPQCWIVEQGETGITATYTGNPNSTPLYEAERDQSPIPCPGPKVGV